MAPDISDNTWPGGVPRAMYPSEHEAWNAVNFPGTRQTCFLCGEPTDRCEEDSIYVEDLGPLCEGCYSKRKPTACPSCQAPLAKDWSKCGMCKYDNPEYVKRPDAALRVVAMGVKPDPFKFYVETLEHHCGCTIIQAKYAGCKTFNGSKLMLLRGVYREPFEALDPHFLDEDYAVIARFTPNDIGWEMAYAAAAKHEEEQLKKHKG